MSELCSIIIVNWKSVKYLKKCLISIVESKPATKYEVIVIDNASYDGSDELMREWFPQFRFIQSDKNLGFAGANNKAAIEAIGKWLFFLNPDTILKDGALDFLCSALSEKKKGGIAGAKLFNSDESVQLSCILRFPSIINQFFGIEAAKNVFSHIVKNEVAILNQQDSAPVTVQAVSGAALLISRDVFNKVGGFSSEYFMYSEDVDICKKVTNEGLNVIHVPKSRITHFGGGASSMQAFSLFETVLQRESIFVYFKKFYGFNYAVAYRISVVCNATIRIAFAITILPIILLIKKKYTIFFIRKWFHVLKWSLGLEFWARNDKLLENK